MKGLGGIPLGRPAKPMEVRGPSLAASGLYYRYGVRD